ncbi:hypothetical protein ACQVP2_34265 [Methylobacterium aquaticum]|uniref:hypothetical protein n=1 Tax=Methylobacterium aquaticum TaxID=270351 RepID=UPI003D16CF25
MMANDLRNEPLPDLSGDALDEFLSTQAQSCDWREAPDGVLSSVSFLLKPYGLEVVMMTTGDDSYAFRIAPIATA